MELKLKVGEKAPDFTLPDQDGATHRLRNYRGKWVLLYFYPQDNTSGCTMEACMIRDNFPHFKKLDVQVLGMSVDSVESHKKFAEKYSLPFTLLSDEKKDVVKRYGVWGKKGEGEGTYRTSFLIDGEGNIAKIYENVQPEMHAEQVLEYLKSKR